ncbi:hypothetical protein D3C71_256480 [compost metagenome]
MEDETKILNPKQFWEMAATWGSAMTSGDPGACMYGFDERGVVQSEGHRQACIDYIESECRRAAEINIAAGEDAAEQHGEIEAMLAYLKGAPVDGEQPEMDSFTEAYVTAALWSTNDESSEDGGQPLDDNYGSEHIDAETIQQMIADCAHFQTVYGHLLVEENYVGRASGTALEQAGHDFWLNRNRHGAGFWDGDWKDPVGDILSEASYSFGECDLYVGDDGHIHVSGGRHSPDPVASLVQANTPHP